MPIGKGPHMGFAERLNSCIKAKKTPVVVGIDPRWELLPNEETKSRNTAVFGDNCGGHAISFMDFSLEIINIVKDLVPAIKIQSAFFELLGSNGISVLRHIAETAQDAGLIVIMDGKRCDIGSTAAAYAQAYLGSDFENTWPVDALTVVPWTGKEGMLPFFEGATANDNGVFVLVRSSNAGAEPIQGKASDLDAPLRAVCGVIADYQEQVNEGEWSSIGAVVGATHPQELAIIRSLLPHSIFLVPGYGAQGGTAADIASAFREDGLGAIVNNSRGIIFAKREGKNWKEAVRAATEDMINDLADNTPVGNL